MDLLIPIVPVNQECVLARETTPDVLREPLINHLEINKTQRVKPTTSTLVLPQLKTISEKQTRFSVCFVFFTIFIFFTAIHFTLRL